MDLDDLRRLAQFYQVHPAALLMTPQEANPTIVRMQRAASLAEKMDPEAAETWLKMGEMASPRGS
jgi:hypothetical protein